MSTKARVEHDPRSFGVRIAVLRDYGDSREILQWEPLVMKTITERASEPDGADWLQLPDDVAHAFYEALAEHFGHGGHDTRALRRDYDAERRRVDLLIDKLVKP
jgi:hypothetical protein